jgi:hypothetical protein
MPFAEARFVIKDAILRVCSSETLAVHLENQLPPVTVAYPGLLQGPQGSRHCISVVYPTLN